MLEVDVSEHRSNCNVFPPWLQRTGVSKGCGCHYETLGKALGGGGQGGGEDFDFCLLDKFYFIFWEEVRNVF